MNRRPDDDLRELFDVARRSDEAKAPPFRRLLERRAPRRSVRPLRTTSALAVVAALLLVAVLATLSRRPRPVLPGRIETWKPPTDFLLESAIPELLVSTPSLTPPVPDYSQLLAKEKGRKS